MKERPNKEILNKEVTKMKILKLAGLAALLAASMSLSGCYSTDSNQVGVKTRKIFGKGVEQTVYEPGQTYFFVPGFSRFDRLDISTKTIEMTTMPKTEGENPKDYGRNSALPLKTLEGNDVWVALTVSYKINPSKAPFIVDNVATSDEEIKEVLVMGAVRSVARRVFGELNSEQFYDSSERTKKTLKVEGELKALLGPQGVIIEGASLSNYTFNNPDYRRAIESRRMAPQDEQRENDRFERVVNQGQRELETAIGQYNTKIAEANGEAERLRNQADAEFYTRQQDAFAKLKESEAVAAGNTRLREALAGEGGITQIRMRYYEVMTEVSRIMIGMPTGGFNVKNTDVNQLLETAGLKAMVERQEQQNNRNNTPATTNNASANTNTKR